MAKRKPIYRIKFVYDEDASFEECNGESRPLTEAEYAENSYRACPDHPRAGSKLITLGPPQVQGCATCGNTEYQDVPYAEYLAFYGNPERHVYLGCVVEKQCPCCHGWEAEGGDSLWGIDVMDTDSSLGAINMGEWLTEAEARGLPDYLGEVASELLP